MTTAELYQSSLESAERAQRAPVPARFFVSMAAIYLLIIGSYFSLYTPLHAVVINNWWINPALTLLVAGLCSSLLIAAIGTGSNSLAGLLPVWIVVISLGSVVAAYEIAVLIQMAGGQIEALKPLWEYIPSIGQRYATPSQASFVIAHSAGIVVLEELAKLAPVLVLIAIGQIRSMQSALCAAALTGLTYGLMESNCYGYTDFVGVGEPLTEYLSRYFTMSTTHALWDATGAGVAMLLCLRGSSLGGCVLGFIVTITMHLCHNFLQEIFTPAVQVATILGVIFPVYVLTKRGWRTALPQPPRSGAAIMISIGFTLLLTTVSAAAHFVQWDTSKVTQQVVLVSQSMDQISRVLEKTDAPFNPQMVDEFDARQPIEARMGQDLKDLAHWVRDAGPNRHNAAAHITRIDLVAGRFRPADIRLSINAQRPFELLDDLSHELNRISRSANLQPQHPATLRWNVTVDSVDTTASVPQDGSFKFFLILLNGKQADEPLVPAAQSDVFAASLASPWAAEMTAQNNCAILSLAGMDSRGGCRILDYAVLPTKSLDGNVKLARGTLIRLKVMSDQQ